MAEAFCVLRDLKLPVSGYIMGIGLVEFSHVQEILLPFRRHLRVPHVTASSRLLSAPSAPASAAPQWSRVELCREVDASMEGPRPPSPIFTEGFVRVSSQPLGFSSNYSTATISLPSLLLQSSQQGSRSISLSPPSLSLHHIPAQGAMEGVWTKPELGRRRSVHVDSQFPPPWSGHPVRGALLPSLGGGPRLQLFSLEPLQRAGRRLHDPNRLRLPASSRSSSQRAPRCSQAPSPGFLSVQLPASSQLLPGSVSQLPLGPAPSELPAATRSPSRPGVPPSSPRLLPFGPASSLLADVFINSRLHPSDSARPLPSAWYGLELLLLGLGLGPPRL